MDREERGRTRVRRWGGGRGQKGIGRSRGRDWMEAGNSKALGRAGKGMGWRQGIGRLEEGHEMDGVREAKEEQGKGKN